MIAVRLDNTEYPADGGTVVATGATFAEVRQKILDRDGCIPADIRFWKELVPVSIGDKVKVKPYQSSDQLVELSRAQDLYFVGDDGHAIFIPQGWADAFHDYAEEDDGLSIYCWIGGSEASAWKQRPGREYLTTDAQGWMSVKNLQRLRQVSRDEARKLDPNLFDLLDAVDNGDAQ